MNCERSHSLENALEISIRRILHSFDKGWLFTESEEDAGNYIDKQVEEKKEDYQFLYNPSQHDFTEICICVDGILALKIGKHIIELKEGFAGLILPGILHCEIPVKNQNYLAMWLVINKLKARLHLSGSREQEFFTSDLRFLNSCDEYNILLNRVMAESGNNKSNAYEMIKSCLLQMYIAASRDITAEESLTERYSPWKERIASDIKNYIRHSGFVHLKLRDISQEMCISENHMNSIFKSVTGMTIAQYIDNQRVDKAKVLLSDSTQTINAISSQLGYYDRYHFSKVFKKATGYSPGQYRNNFSKNLL